eukprot:TRINITY_DN1943_c0_g1_i1.p1 TRINITY_DN1943_c0_g1~~TRINITY_DN1943_c0_g1_i1.p1  ORF type:complete len:752 (-),score=313.02 TRINITY_DN1943_c0_g1_i1:35-2290(-)
MGKQLSEQVLNYYKDGHFPYQFKKEEGTGALRIVKKGDAVFTPEELMAQVFQAVKTMASKSAGTPTRDAVITVPNYFTVGERKAIMDAAELAGLKVLSLIADTTAVAMGFGIERSFEQDQNYLFYDMGAQGVKVSLVHFNKRPTKRTAGKMQVRATTWNREVGGDQFDFRLANHYAEHFAKTPGVDIDPKDNPRLMAKLKAVARKAKEVLSANTETVSAIESLYNDIDFRIMITRTQFEELCADLLEAAVQPLVELKKVVNFNVDEIKDLEMFGSGSRIPKLQEMIADVLGKPVAKHVNADEAAVVGATYQAAKLSASFHVRFEATDVSGYTVQVGKKGHTLTTLYSERSKLGTKKKLTFSKMEDVVLVTRYSFDGENTEQMVNPLISETTVSDVQKNFVDQFDASGKNITKGPEIQVTFDLDHNGFFGVNKADVAVTESIESTEQVKKPKVKKEKKEKKENGNSLKSDTDDEEEEEIETRVVYKKRVHRFPLTISVDAVGSRGMSSEQRKTSLKVLQDIDVKEEVRQRTAEAKNSLESYLYNTKDKMQSLEGIEDVSTAQQREDIMKVLDDATEWLYDEGEDADAKTYLNKLSECENAGAAAMFLRHNELTKRPRAIKILRATIELARKKLEGWEGDEYSGVTETEMDSLADKCDSADKWLKKKTAEQSKTAGHEDPKLLSADILQRNSDISSKLKYMLSKPRKPTPTPTPKSTPTPEPEPEQEGQADDEQPVGEEEEQEVQEQEEDQEE